MQQIISPVAGCMRWGKWGANFSVNEYRQMIDDCLANNITSFDHADIYGDYTTEEEFGEALKQAPQLRSKMQLITKCGIQMISANRSHHQVKSYNTSKEHIISSVERSLQNFGTDYIDVLLIHRPDPLLNPNEVAEAVEELKQSGKIVHFGVSNFLPHHTNVLQQFIAIEYNQVEISLLRLKPFIDGTLDNCLQHGIKPMAWAPLGGGVLNEDSHPHYRAIATAAGKLAEQYATGVNQILIAWLLTHPTAIIPVLGTTKLERLLQAQEALKIKLTNQEWFMLYEASRGEEVE